jgi:cell division protein ZapA (FtsZ GTPase activity inhibitor)
MSSEGVRVRIFGKDYSLKSADTDAETIKQAAQYVNSKIAELQELTAAGNDTRVAVLTALSIAGELFEARAKYEAEARKVRECQEKIRSINEKISGMKNTG